MAQGKHTQGPWNMETVRTSCGLCHRVGPFPSPKWWRTDKPAHACIYDDYPPEGGSPELVANARLIAAAPELYRELRGTRCPRPCIHRHDEFEVGQCVDAGECGCSLGEAVRKAEAR